MNDSGLVCNTAGIFFFTPLKEIIINHCYCFWQMLITQSSNRHSWSELWHHVSKMLCFTCTHGYTDTHTRTHSHHWPSNSSLITAINWEDTKILQQCSWQILKPTFCLLSLLKTLKHNRFDTVFTKHSQNSPPTVFFKHYPKKTVWFIVIIDVCGIYLENSHCCSFSDVFRHFFKHAVGVPLQNTECEVTH